jgi:hypothetical protein
MTIGTLGPIVLIVGLVFACYAVYRGSKASQYYGGQYALLDGPTSKYVQGATNADPTVMATASTNAAVQNWTLRVGQQSCYSANNCALPSLVLPTPDQMIDGTVITVRNGSVDTEMQTRLAPASFPATNGYAYVSPPQKVEVKVGTTGTDYIARGDSKSYLVVNNAGVPTWYHIGLPSEGYYDLFTSNFSNSTREYIGVPAPP